MLSKARQSWEQLAEDLARSKDQISDLEARIAAFEAKEEAVTAALVSAQDAANEVKQNALKQADRITEDARQRARQMEAELQERLNALRWDFEKLSIEKQRFVEEFRTLLEQHLGALTAEVSPRAMPSHRNGSHQPAERPMEPEPLAAEATSTEEAEQDG